MTVDYEQELQAAKETIEAQDQLLKQLAGNPWGLGTIVRPSEHEGQATFVVAEPGGLIEVAAPKDMELCAGDMVRLNPETHAIICPATAEGHGGIVVVEKVREDFLEISKDGQMALVHRGQLEPEQGERVVLDLTGSVATQNLGREEERFRFDATSGICWDDIGGLHEVKRQMIEAIELPHKHPELYEQYGKKPVSGVLLYGPPGCGKTMLGKATSTALATIFGREHGGFFYVKGPEILNMYVGNSEAAIRQLFERARRFKAENGHPAVVFIDEADAILGRRGMGISSDMEKTIVPMFLTEMDGLEASGALVILATNRQDVLDPAVVREGRIDRHIRVTRPDQAASKEIFDLYLKQVPIADIGDLAAMGAAALFDQRKAFGRVRLTQGVVLFTLGCIVHGGMIENIVDQATSFAIARDLSKARSKKGLKASDITEAVERVFAQNKDLDHKDAVLELQENLVAV